MLLLEYFLPELFRTFALDAAAHEGRSETLASLEGEIRQDDAAARRARWRAGHGVDSEHVCDPSGRHAHERAVSHLGTRRPAARRCRPAAVRLFRQRALRAVGRPGAASESGGRARTRKSTVKQRGVAAGGGGGHGPFAAARGHRHPRRTDGVRAVWPSRSGGTRFPLAAMLEIAKRRPEVALIPQRAAHPARLELEHAYDAPAHAGHGPDGHGGRWPRDASADTIRHNDEGEMLAHW